MSKKLFHLPNVLLVGRTNVGKSTLFNRLIDSKKSIVFDQEGITRDYIQETISWGNRKFNLIDTGGVSYKKPTDFISQKIQEKVFQLFEKASLIVFVCDVKNGLTQEDQKIAKILHKTNKPLILVLNKADNIKALEENLSDFYKLGIKNIITVSAIHGQGIVDLLDEIVKIIPNAKDVEEEEISSFRIVILGKPNVGKSSLMNLLLKTERSIVYEQAGTTREAITENFIFAQDLIQITDTAGIRKQSKIKEDIESLMIKSSLSAVRQSDLVLLIVDASQLKLSDQELKLLFYTFEQKKCLILVFNKTDLLTPQDREELEYSLKEYDFILKKIPIIWISCKSKKNVHKIFREIEKIKKRLNQKFDRTEITELIKEQLNRKPMYHKTNLIKISKVIPVNKFKIPTFIIFANHPQWIGESQLGFLENTLRKNYDLKGCPIKFEVRK
ncbi:ribosome biogenesis GTPase Der [Candidatus Dependentiae bacterium]|nr:ribosome biogenesis GTPase Der [Candidatus Dependentiae bacterium]